MNASRQSAARGATQVRAAGSLAASVERRQPVRGECSRKIIDFYSDTKPTQAVVTGLNRFYNCVL